MDLLATTLEALAQRSGIDPGLVDDVIVGCVSQAGQQTFNVARNGVLAAGWPESVPATTVDRQCGSSQQALHFAAQGVIAGSYDVAVVAGVESMSRVPMGSSMGGQDPFGTRIPARYAGGLIPQGISAELIAARWDLDREALDTYAAQSHQRAHAAAEDGRSSGRIVALPVDRGDGLSGETISRDEGVRPTRPSTRSRSCGPRSATRPGSNASTGCAGSCTPATRRSYPTARRRCSSWSVRVPSSSAWLRSRASTR